VTRPEILMLGKLALTFAVLIGIPAWELYALRKDRLRRERDEGQG
jgi:hypothetical protein